MKLINCTPHPVVVANGSLKITIAKDPKDPIVRIRENVIHTLVDYEIAEGITATIQMEAHCSYEVDGLPAPEPGVIYIVSSMVASAVKRADVVSPITDSTCERDEKGRVISVRGFQTYTPDYKERSKVPAWTPEAIPVKPFTIEAFDIDQVLEDTKDLTARTPEDEAMIIEMEAPAEMPSMEVAEEILPARELVAVAVVPKVDALMLDPIKAAARAKYEKRMAKTKVVKNKQKTKKRR